LRNLPTRQHLEIHLNLEMADGHRFDVHQYLVSKVVLVLRRNIYVINVMHR